jgi:soluble lytic murein transglycosylase-like protein
MRQSEQLARKYGLNPRLVQAVITVESNFDVDAVSFAGAQGLMQLMPATSQAYGIRNPFDPAENLAGGIRHLRDLLEHFAGNLSLALAAYNAGTAAVEKFQGIPPFSETQTYVQRVLRLYKGNRGVQKRPQVFQYTDKEHGLILLTDTPLYGDRKTKLFPQREQGVGTQ